MAWSEREAAVYQIRIEGHLDARWSDWFDGLSLRTEEDGSSVLAGRVADQAALHGLLERVRDLGLTLLSVNRAEAGVGAHGRAIEAKSGC